MKKNNYIKFISDLKQAILESRYQSAKLVNRELLLLYFNVGKTLSVKIEKENWGAKVLQTISSDLQSHLSGLRGFSYSNLKNMKQFYEAYHNFPISQSVTGQLKPAKIKGVGVPKSTLTLSKHNIESFWSISFTHHMTLLNKVNSWDELFFYINQSAINQWSVSVLEYQVNSKLFHKKGKIQNNFKSTLPGRIQKHAIQAFKDEYLLDFLNINDEHDERVLESHIVSNIRNFILSIGKEFSFIGNQYRLIIDGEEFFVDLLFFPRGLQALVAVELKTGKFKPEYAGKMNFYLAALNKKVRLAHENPSIGIILCKEKSKSVVEFSFQDVNKPIGVGTYRLSESLPAKLKKYFPGPNEFKKILTKN